LPPPPPFSRLLSLSPSLSLSLSLCSVTYGSEHPYFSIQMPYV
jgi:hypothetical protein